LISKGFLILKWVRSVKKDFFGCSALGERAKGTGPRAKAEIWKVVL
jgi:hypothetical protein